MKNRLALIILIILLIILGFLSFIFFKNLNEKSNRDFNKVLTTMGEEIYSDYYYKIVSIGKTKQELEEYLKKFEKIGLKFNLTELEKYNEIFYNNIQDFSKKNSECSKDEVEVIIYPKAPYENKDIDVKINMNCN